MTVNYEPSKRNPFKKRMTGAGRARKVREARSKASEKIKAALGITAAISNSQLLEIAAARLAGVGAGNPVLDFDFAAKIYMTQLAAMTGNCIPTETFWSQFLDLVKEANPALAITFANEFRNQFLGCLAGHVHRLNMEHNQLPDSIKNMLIIIEAEKLLFAAEYQDGTIVPMPEEGFRRLDPCIIFAGTEERPPLNPNDFKRLLQMDAKHAAKLGKSGKFKLSLPKRELFTSDTVLNVATPENLASIRINLSILGYKPSRKK